MKLTMPWTPTPTRAPAADKMALLAQRPRTPTWALAPYSPENPEEGPGVTIKYLFEAPLLKDIVNGGKANAHDGAGRVWYITVDTLQLTQFSAALKLGNIALKDQQYWQILVLPNCSVGGIIHNLNGRT